MILAAIASMAMAPASIEEILSRPIDATAKRYNARDDKGMGLDCIKIEQIAPNRYIGIHHTMMAGIFHLRLVESANLLDWKHIRTVDEHGHQGTLRKAGKRWLMAWEKDGKEGNWIRLVAFDSTDDLISGKVAKQFDLPRELSKFAEGTPSIYGTVPETGDWDRSQLDIRFHYWRDGDVDRQAEGKLLNFKIWRSQIRQGAPTPLESIYRGNIGDRDYFTANRQNYEVLEAQLKKDDWAGWRILLREGSKAFNELKIVTEKNSKSFANPTVTNLTLPNGKPGLGISYFMPSQGNHKDESGQLIFYRELS